MKTWLKHSTPGNIPCPVESILGYLVRPGGKASSWTKGTSACKVSVTMATRQGCSGGTWLGSLARAREESPRQKHPTFKVGPEAGPRALEADRETVSSCPAGAADQLLISGQRHRPLACSFHVLLFICVRQA